MLATGHRRLAPFATNAAPRRGWPGIGRPAVPAAFPQAVRRPPDGMGGSRLYPGGGARGRPGGDDVLADGSRAVADAEGAGGLSYMRDWLERPQIDRDAFLTKELGLSG